MSPQAGPPASGERFSTPQERDPLREYRRLICALTARAARLGSRDPESAAQEALRRSLENPKSQAAAAFYFTESPPAGSAPDWPLDQLLAWLHGVLQFVVREEQSRAAYRREIPSNTIADVADRSHDVLDRIVERETRAIVDDCFRTLDAEYREVLTLRIDGVKYSEIARRMGVNE